MDVFFENIVGILENITGENLVVGASILLVIILAKVVVHLIKEITDQDRRKIEYEDAVNKRKNEEVNFHQKHLREQSEKMEKRFNEEIKRLTRNHEQELTKLERLHKNEIKRLEKIIESIAK